ncbi:E3 ubiquitin-protein ligase SNT2 [Cyberlindnera fabianii]|uniref:E3 ubiquitin-protein ligase SNT2 n=1 Tax=Cyberlindnera fabianii TaxID=36022 RepID=A0A1V2L726_CYBFA|nr:E3 ubiquitin-protein ligase SNT2 [Cyberlindnera fabianii]
MTESARPRRRAVKVDYTERPVEALPPRPTEAEVAEGREKAHKEHDEKPKKRQRDRPAKELSPSPEKEEDYFPMNWQPATLSASQRFSNVPNLTGAFVRKGVELVLKNGTVLRKDDSIYLICEPPGEPYYIGRIMGFARKSVSDSSNDHTPPPETRPAKEPAELFTFKINWWYRCRDISKHSSDSRLLFASMHSDTCPLQSFRGVCTVKHKDEIQDLDEYKSVPNQFWFDKLFDRYMIKFYDVIPTQSLENLPPNYREALNKRFQYIFVEAGKSRDMLQRPKNCVKCNQWCIPQDSIQCCECEEYYHMLCLDPPLLKKPARGFAWSCINCTKLLEAKKMATEFARLGREASTSVTSSSSSSSISPSTADHEDAVMEDVASTASTSSQEPAKLPSYEELAIQFLERDKDLTFKQRRNLEEWQYRYLGMHAKLEDALDLQDRPYPRAASRLGAKNQFSDMVDWFDHPVVYYDYSELNEEFQTPGMFKVPKSKGGRKKKEVAPSAAAEGNDEQKPLPVPQEYKETDPSDFPPWLQPRPKGYVERGGDDTVTLMWKEPEDVSVQERVEKYLTESGKYAQAIDLLPNTPNFVDRLLKNLLDENFDFEKADELNKQITRESLREPTFTNAEVKKFEAGIRKYGSELWPTFKEVKTQPFSMIVRFWYLWKKTTAGHQIWDNFEGRKKNMRAVSTDTDESDIANAGDDSSYDSKKAAKRHFVCKHCDTEDSVQWFRVSGAQRSEEQPGAIMALCMRCARLWRRYAVHWEDPVEVLKKVNIKGGSSWKRRIEQELIDDAELIVATKKAALNGEKVVYKKRQTKHVHANDGESSSTSVTPTPRKGSESASTSSATPSKEKKGSNKKSSSTAPAPAEPPQPEEPVISTIVNDNTVQTLHQQVTQRYYHLTSAQHNPRPKFKDFTTQASSLGNANDTSIAPRSTIIGKHCGVCRDPATNSDALLCFECGVLIHPACYGFQDAPTKGRSWYCDTCSNCLHPLISQHYVCVICRDASLDCDGVKPAMKRTNAGKWVHVLCMLATPGLKCLDIGCIQPIDGVEKVIAEKSMGQLTDPEIHCVECQKVAPVKDLLYGEKFDVGFEVKLDDKIHSKGVKVSSTQSGKLALAARCREHTEPPTNMKFLKFTDPVKRFRVSGVSPALRVFLEESKRMSTLLSGNQARFKDLIDAYNIISTGLAHSGKYREPDVCSVCGNTVSLKWVETSGGKRSCYGCWLNVQNQDADIAMIDTDDEDADIVSTDSTSYLKVIDTLNSPIACEESYGITGLHDKLRRSSSVKQPSSPVEPKKLESTGSLSTDLPAMATFTNTLHVQAQAPVMTKPGLPSLYSASFKSDAQPTMTSLPLISQPLHDNRNTITLPPIKSFDSPALSSMKTLPQIEQPSVQSAVEMKMEEPAHESKVLVPEDKKPNMNKMSIGSILG